MVLCAWCREREATSKDHVFPEAVGGTRELVLPACKPCQACIRGTEEELARRSEFAIHRGAREFRPKNLRSDPSSGSIEAVYCLRALEGDGLAEVVVQGGQAKTLPSIEVDLTTGKGRTRGFRADIERLIEVLKWTANTPGAAAHYCWLSGSEGFSDVAENAEFWPRVFLDLDGELHLRARTQAEGETCMSVLLNAAGAGVFGRPEFNLNKDPWEVPAGTPHRIVIQWEERFVLRVMAKIAYGVAYKHAGDEFMSRDPFPLVRRYVLGEDVPPRAEEVLPAGSLRDWPEHHVAAVHTLGSSVSGLVSLYGALHLVNLGPAPDPNPWREPVAARCTRWAPTRVEWLSAGEAKQVMDSLGGYAASAAEDGPNRA